MADALLGAPADSPGYGSVQRSESRSVAANAPGVQLPLKDLAEEDEGTTLNSQWDMFYYIIKTILTPVVLALPKSFQLMGLWGGVMVLTLSTLLSNFTQKKLLELKWACGGGDVSYLTIAQRAYGTAAASVVYFLLVLANGGLCISYVVMLARIVQTIHPIDDLFSTEATMALSQVVVLPAALWLLMPQPWIRSARAANAIGVLNVTCVLMCVTIVYAYGLVEQLQLNGAGDYPSVKHTLFLGAGTVALITFTNGMTLPLGATMAQPRRFPQTLDAAMGVLFVNNMLFGVFGYLFFEDKTEGVVILSVPQVLPVLAVKIAMAVNVLAMYVVVFHPVASSVENNLLGVREGMWGKRVATRVLLSLVLLALACSVPDFQLMTNLLGGLSAVPLGVVLPLLFHLRLLRARLTRTQWAMEWCLVLGGGASAATMVVWSVQNIISRIVK